MPRVKSMDVTIAGYTRSFDFGSGVKVDSQDEGQASLELLHDATTSEVVLGSDVVASASVRISYRVVHEGEVYVDLDDLEEEELEDEQAVLDYVDDNWLDLSAVVDAIERDLENIDTSDVTLEDVSVDGVYDEDGEFLHL